MPISAASRFHQPPLAALAALALLALPIACGAPPPAPAESRQRQHTVLEWTGAHDAPASLSWQTTIAGADEPGERIEIDGRILDADREPAAGVLLYVYHTNAAGVYPRRGDETGNGRRHGYLRGWMRTDRSGRYRFRTIRPGPYPGRDDPVHIHATVVATATGGRERWIDDFWFAGDPRITPEQRAARGGRSSDGAILELRRGDDGTWRASRDIVLRDWPWLPGER